MKGILTSFLSLLVALSLFLSSCAKPPPAATTPTTLPPAVTATPGVTARPSPTATQGSTLTPQYGGVLKVIDAAPRSLIPEINVIKNWFQKVNFDTLLKMDEKGNLQPNLVTDWKLSPDNKSLTLTVRQGVKFHDGTDLNAAAVKYNLEKRKAARVGDFDEVSTFDVVDDYTLRLNLAQFSNKLFVPLWFIGGMQNSPTAYERYGKDALWNPVGTGPFRFVKYDVNVVIKYERFDAYWQQGRPYLDGYETHVIVDPNTQELTLRKGEVHSANLQPRILDALEKEGWTVLKAPWENYQALSGDTANADSPFANVKVRQAIEYAIDRPAIVKALGYGLMEAMEQFAPSGHYAYITGFKGREYDPVKAKQLLAEAGYPNGFKTKLITRVVDSQLLVAVQGYLKAVGIDAEIDYADASRYNSNSTGGWKNAMMHRVPRVMPDWLSQYNAQFAANAREFVSVLKTPEHQKLLAEALAATDAATKSAAAQKLNRYLFDQAMHLPIYGTTSTLIHAKNVHNMEFYNPWGANKLWSPADVWMTK